MASISIYSLNMRIKYEESESQATEFAGIYVQLVFNNDTQGGVV